MKFQVFTLTQFEKNEKKYAYLIKTECVVKIVKNIVMSISRLKFTT